MGTSYNLDKLWSGASDVRKMSPSVIGVLRHMQRYFSYIFDDTYVQAYGRATIDIRRVL